LFQLSCTHANKFKYETKYEAHSQAVQALL
jgi:hypothetical protein